MKKVFLHPITIRVWHWINASLIFLLVITGVQLRFPGVNIFYYGHAAFFHRVLGFVLAGSFLYWFLYYLVTGGLSKHYLIHPRDLKGMMHQAFFYIFSMFKGTRNPFAPSAAERFNPLQKVAYLSLMLILMPVIIVTGVLLSDIVYFLNIINFMGGIRILDAVHVATGYAFILYLIVHLYMATLGYRLISHIKAMITGYGEEQDEPGERPGS
jgi:thiosulfate reductase cytochrome b subunit